MVQTILWSRPYYGPVTEHRRLRVVRAARNRFFAHRIEPPLPAHDRYGAGAFVFTAIEGAVIAVNIYLFDRYGARLLTDLENWQARGGGKWAEGQGQGSNAGRQCHMLNGRR